VLPGFPFSLAALLHSLLFSGLCTTDGTLTARFSGWWHHSSLCFIGLLDTAGLCWYWPSFSHRRFPVCWRSCILAPVCNTVFVCPLLIAEFTLVCRHCHGLSSQGQVMPYHCVASLAPHRVGGLSVSSFPFQIPCQNALHRLWLISLQY